MQVSIESTSILERRLTIGVPAERIESEVNSRLQQAAQNVRLKGFRPGKVPMNVIRQRFGDGVRQEVLGEVMSRSFYEAVQQEKLKPAGRPSIEPKTMEPGKDLEYVAVFEVFPDVEPRDYSAIEVIRLSAELTDKDVDTMIENLRKQAGTWDVVDRAAQDGDQVVINYVGTKDGEAFDGGSAENSPLTLGSGRMIPGFEAAIVGMKAGEEKVVPLTFPAEYHNEALKGAAVEFKITVNEVKALKLAELNDEFFKKFGVKEGGEEQFRKEVRENMARELKNAVKNKLKNQVMNGLLKVHEDLLVPAALVGEEIQTLRGQTVQQFGGAGNNPSIDFAKLLPDDMFRAQAERRVRLGLLLNAIITRGEVKADADKVRAAVEELASTYEDPQEVIDWYYGNRQQLQGIESMVLEDQIVEQLLAAARVIEQAASYEEALKPESTEG
jgi:trigger factor